MNIVKLELDLTYLHNYRCHNVGLHHSAYTRKDENTAKNFSVISVFRLIFVSTGTSRCPENRFCETGRYVVVMSMDKAYKCSKEWDIARFVL